jgi:hypothetical protein
MYILLAISRLKRYTYGMANHNPKGLDRMRAMGHVGGIASGEARRLYAVQRRLANWNEMQQIGNAHGFTDEEIAQELDPVDTRGGSHDDDWRCPHCRQFNSIKSRACAKCGAVSPRNGRLTRAELRERIAGHRYAAMLREVVSPEA